MVTSVRVSISGLTRPKSPRVRASLVHEGKINPSRYFKDGRNPTSRHAAVSCAAAGNVFALHAGRRSLCRTYRLRLEDKGWLTLCWLTLCSCCRSGWPPACSVSSVPGAGKEGLPFEVSCVFEPYTRCHRVVWFHTVPVKVR